MAALVLLSACGGSGSGAATGSTSLTTPSTTAPVLAAGEGSVTLGGDAQAFAVASCTEKAGADDSPQAHQEFRLRGTGNDGSVDFTVTVTRFSSDTGKGSLTITETASVGSGTGGSALGIEAKRTSIRGDWVDLNQPAVTEPLLVRRGSLVTVDATFGPEGSVAGDEGLTPGSIRARCPA